MSLDGAGTYTPPAPEFPAIPGTTILASDFNAIILDIAAAISQAIFRDGQAAFTANQSMGTFKLVNLGNGSAPQDAVTFLQVFTDPTFVGTTTDGVEVTGTRLTVSTETVILPAGTAVGDVTAAELAVLHGLTASTAELNLLDGVTATTAELNILDGVGVTATELNSLENVTGNVQGQLDLKAPLASPALTGSPTTPTPPTGVSSTQIANMAAVLAQAFLTALPLQAGNAGKFVTTDGTNASWDYVPQFPSATLSVR